MREQQTRLEALKEMLDAQEVEFRFLEHEITLKSAESGPEHGVGALAEMAPTFILKTEKGFMAAIVSGDRRLSYKKIKKELGLKDVSLANPELVKEVTGAEIGYVSLINVGLQTIVDAQVLEKEYAYGGCGIPAATLQIRPGDLVRVSSARVFDFSEKKDL